MRYTFLVGLLLLAASATAQYPLDYDRPLSWSAVSDGARASVPTHFVPPQDLAALKAADLQREKNGQPYRFAVPQPQRVSPASGGQWFELPDGRRMWLARFYAPGALSVGVLFRNFHLPEGARLTYYNGDRTQYHGTYTHLHNTPDARFATLPVAGEELYIEYIAPKEQAGVVPFEIHQANYGYRDVFATMRQKAAQQKAFGSSGGCNRNVNCPDGNRWNDQQRGVVYLLIAGSFLCSGSMINNTAQDDKALVLTAFHCYDGVGASGSDNFLFNWEAAGCTNPTSLAQTQFITGASELAKLRLPDFFLLQLASSVPASYNTYYNGWDRSGNVPDSTVCIHHPSGDIKKISFDDNDATSVGIDPTSFITIATQNCWQVQWDRSTTTEGGSSGSPLFDATSQLIIGQLLGGGASCFSLSAPDYYGKVSLSWDGGNTNSTRLSNHLDPLNTGVTTLAGKEPGVVTSNDAPQQRDASLSVYPNPAAGPITIRWAGEPGATVLADIDAADGRCLATLSLNWDAAEQAYTAEVAAGSLAPGFYLVRVYDEAAIGVRKLVVR